MDTKIQNMGNSAQNPMPEKLKTNWSDTMHVITYIIVLVGLGLIIWQVWSYSKTNKTSEYSSQSNETRQPVSEWQTYKSSNQYDFIFQYPQSLTLSQKTNDVNTQIIKQGDAIVGFISIVQYYDIPDLSLYAKQYPGGYQTKQEEIKAQNETPMTINGSKALVQKISFTNQVNLRTDGVYYYYYSNPSIVVLHFVATYDSKTADLIANSLKFTNLDANGKPMIINGESGDNWTTYTGKFSSSEYGFSLQLDPPYAMVQVRSATGLLSTFTVDTEDNVLRMKNPGGGNGLLNIAPQVYTRPLTVEEEGLTIGCGANKKSWDSGMFIDGIASSVCTKASDGSQWYDRTIYVKSHDRKIVLIITSPNDPDTISKTNKILAKMKILE